MSHNPVGLHGLLQGQLYPLFLEIKLHNNLSRYDTKSMILFMILSMDIVVKRVAPQFCFMEILGSNLGLKNCHSECFKGFSQSHQANAAMVLQIMCYIVRYGQHC
jgi:hypothetical protein